MSFGEMAEWLKAPVLKTGIVYYRGFESLSLLFCLLNLFVSLLDCGRFHYHKEREAARLSHLAKPEKWIKYKRS